MSANRPTRREFARTAALAATLPGALQSAPAAGDPKIGLYSITYLGVWYRGEALPLEQVIDRAKEYGYQGVEIDGKRPHGNPLDMPKKRCREIRKYADDRGIELYAVAGNNDFSSPIPEFREAQVVYMRELIRMTSDLGVKTMRVFAAWPGVTIVPGGVGTYDVARPLWGHTHERFSDEQTWAWVLEGMKETTRYARDAGITLALQNHAPVIRSYKDVLRMVREVDSPNLKVCFDARMEPGIDMDSAMRITREIGPLQVLSHAGGEYDEKDGKVSCTEQDKALAQVASLLDAGYRGYIGYEFCHPVPVIGRQPAGIEYIDKNARLAPRFLREMMAEVRRANRT